MANLSEMNEKPVRAAEAQRFDGPINGGQYTNTRRAAQG
jgi:hypothetical protein